MRLRVVSSRVGDRLYTDYELCAEICIELVWVAWMANIKEDLSLLRQR